MARAEAKKKARRTGKREGDAAQKRRTAKMAVKKLSTVRAAKYSVRLRVGARSPEAFFRNTARQLRKAFRDHGLAPANITVGYSSAAEDDFWENPPPPEKKKEVILSCINNFNTETGEWEILCVAIEVSDEPVEA